MIEIHDDFLPNQLAIDVREALLSDNFPWYFGDSIVFNYDCPTAFQFTHSFYTENSGWKSSCSPLIQSMLYVAQSKLNIPINNIIRIKANLLTLTGYPADPSNIHRDTDKENCRSLIYYVDDYDGNTLILDDKKENIIQQITPKKNSAIFFDSNTWHSSSPPMKNKRRVVINTILKV
jgi:hypothetical protein